ncbi:hypothetical protein [Streptomyces sp. NBC_00696]|uniref:hypothetical protein n=1 Tax=Streptomyces sp. NBC_00696 TaxID=2903672 RepID=UPI002E358BFD|nr:hypothetical protein [Streptomyces sp. NBC_00696]
MGASGSSRRPPPAARRPPPAARRPPPAARRPPPAARRPPPAARRPPPAARRPPQAASGAELATVSGFVRRTDAPQILADRLARRLEDQIRRPSGSCTRR